MIGGFKLWECAIDLVLYLQQNATTYPIHSKFQKVMELGCGHGVPGIFALNQGLDIFLSFLH